MAGYSGTPLPKKLGIREGALVVLIGAPSDFAARLEPLPIGARIARELPKNDRFDVAVVFSSTRRELEKQFVTARKCMKEDAGLWVGWPKKASKVVTDVDESAVRSFGLACGLVDIKVCALDETWSGLRFVIRVADRKK